MLDKHWDSSKVQLCLYDLLFTKKNDKNKQLCLLCNMSLLLYFVRLYLKIKTLAMDVLFFNSINSFNFLIRCGIKWLALLKPCS